MSVADIRQADLIFFESDGKAIDEAIRYLSGANITHAALSYEQGVLVDAGPTGIAAHRLLDNPNGRTIHLRRLDYAKLHPQPVLDAAKTFVSQREQFDYSGMVLVGLLLLYRKEVSSSAVSNWTLAILKRLVLHLDASIQSLIEPAKHPMFCSQFVFTCFQNAAVQEPNYGLSIEDGCLSTAAQSNSLLARVGGMLATGRELADVLPLREWPEHASMSDEELAGELLNALMDPSGGALEQEISSELLHAVAAFDQLLARIHRGEDWAWQRLFLHRQEPLFVTPLDLYAHCPTLQAVETGDLKVDRDPNNVPIGAGSAPMVTMTSSAGQATTSA